MKFLIQVILIALLSFITEQLFVWWTCALSAFFIAAIIPSRSLNSFLAGFLGVGILWLILVSKVNIETDGILTDKIAALFRLGDNAYIIIITSIIGSICGGLGALSGSLFRKLFEEDHKSRYYH